MGERRSADGGVRTSDVPNLPLVKELPKPIAVVGMNGFVVGELQVLLMLG
ncbi:hypothetical protein AB0M83_43035 [Amycolatopsis sp. NPDC051106]